MVLIPQQIAWPLELVDVARYGRDDTPPPDPSELDDDEFFNVHNELSFITGEGEVHQQSDEEALARVEETAEEDDDEVDEGDQDAEGTEEQVVEQVAAPTEDGDSQSADVVPQAAMALCRSTSPVPQTFESFRSPSPDPSAIAGPSTVDPISRFGDITNTRRSARLVTRPPPSYAPSRSPSPSLKGKGKATSHATSKKRARKSENDDEDTAPPPAKKQKGQHPKGRKAKIPTEIFEQLRVRLWSGLCPCCQHKLPQHSLRGLTKHLADDLSRIPAPETLCCASYASQHVTPESLAQHLFDHHLADVTMGWGCILMFCEDHFCPWVCVRPDRVRQHLEKDSRHEPYGKDLVVSALVQEELELDQLDEWIDKYET